MDKEVWKDIQGYEGLYQISSYGRCRRIDRKYILKPHKTNRGYDIYQLTVKGKIKNYLIHRLVAQTFIPNFKNKPQVNHIDGNKDNNRVDNLEWCTCSENMKHAYDNGLIKICEGINNHNHRSVLQYTKYMKFLKKWNSIAEASRELMLKQASISRVCLGKRKTTGGYIWRYDT